MSFVIEQAVFQGSKLRKQKPKAKRTTTKSKCKNEF
jgi:hypothetical protein